MDAINRSRGKDLLKRSVRILRRAYAAQMHTSLDFSNPWELLVATILSAQSQDRQVNIVTKRLFKKYPSVGDYCDLRPVQLYKYIGSLGLYKGKARNIINAARMVKRDFGSIVPSTMEGLTALPGVGRKTANVVLYNAFHISEGIAIDTHCIVVANRLGITSSSKPEVIEHELMDILPKRQWGDITHLFIALGRDTCTARRKFCARCPLKHICPSSETL